jgi:hypothetical protein
MYIYIYRIYIEYIYKYLSTSIHIYVYINIFIKAKLLPVHLKNECPNRIIYCGLCGSQEEAKKMNLHKNDTCIKRNVCCTNKGCSKVISYCELDKHINNDCKFLFRYCTEVILETGVHM